jgi:hypothetical protein
VDVLSGLILLRPATWTAATAFYRDTLGLAITPAEAQGARPRGGSSLLLANARCAEATCMFTVDFTDIGRLRTSTAASRVIPRESPSILDSGCGNLDRAASGDVELLQDFAEVVVDGVRAEEQLCSDLVVG